jgi:plasmid maintenance system antidote protein VapI
MKIGRPALSNFLNGKSALSAEMAVRLEKTFGADREYLLTLRAAYEQRALQEDVRALAVRSYSPSLLDISARQIEAWADTPNLFSYPADVRFVAPTLRFTNPPFRQWLERIDCYDEDTRGVLDWIDKVNTVLFRKFDALFDE